MAVEREENSKVGVVLGWRKVKLLRVPVKPSAVLKAVLIRLGL